MKFGKSERTWKEGKKFGKRKICGKMENWQEGKKFSKRKTRKETQKNGKQGCIHGCISSGRVGRSEKP